METKVIRKWHQLGAASAACLASNAAGVFQYTSSFIIPRLQEEEAESGLHITDEEGSWFGNNNSNNNKLINNNNIAVSIFLVGCLIGSLTGILQSERLGCRISLMVDTVLTLLALSLVALAHNFNTLLAGRVLGGVALASSLVSSPIYCSEISQPSVRILASSFLITQFNAGFAGIMLLGALLPWRVAVGIVSVPALVAFTGLYFSPDSPTWLARKGRREDAFEALMFLRGDATIVRQELLGIATTEANTQNWKELFTQSSFIKPFMIVLAVIIIGSGFTGIVVIGYYMVRILQVSDLPLSPYWGAAATTTYRAIISFATSNLICRCRRRPVYFATGGLIAMACIMLATYSLLKEKTLCLVDKEWTEWIPLVAIAMAYTGFAGGFCTSMYGYMGELFPADFRSFACGIVGFVNNVVLFGVTKSFPGFVGLVGMHGVFFFFAATTVTLLGVMYFVLPETKGLSLEEIQSQFKTQS